MSTFVVLTIIIAVPALLLLAYHWAITDPGDPWCRDVDKERAHREALTKAATGPRSVP